ncbi:putative uncharacterized protein [Porphyromonas sp. CAG:1061]|uniref:helix-turn-helix domain-containing protein n=1 Tax=Porphyromonas sp. CAG:1061 TaxID=1262916 RepID=UPI00033FC7CE|nr:helix-turn-helix domain-containing protein [Porphyromonas sp. CAG:1061]CCY08646.1 putative uncharacterized protein [Porphyromonas sp. CAG:1061]
MKSTITDLTEITEEFNMYLGKRHQSDLLLSDEDMQVIFKCSRTTLYRARKENRLDYTKGHSGQVVYNYDDVSEAIRKNRFKVRNLSKISMLERLETYRKLLEI